MTREEAIEYLHKLFMQADITDAYGDMDDTEPYETAIDMAVEALKEQHWIPCSERLPKKDDWYLGIFKESDTGWVNPIPQVCGYVGVKTGESTQDGWLLRNVDRHSFGFKYYMSLECVAWMPLPEPYQEEQK